MYAYRRTEHQRRKRTGAGAIIARRTDNHNYGQDRDEWHRDSYWYNSDYVRRFDSGGITELDASQNKALAGVGKAARNFFEGYSREVNTMKVWCRKTMSKRKGTTRGSTRVRFHTRNEWINQ